uniref:Elongator complex protein 4 n=1 Tax=Mantoniella antarctica TaxID=81844 RepID=A0A7S0XAC0_9CHLO
MSRFLRALRGLLRGTRVCAVVVFPVGGVSASAAASLRHAVDAAIDLVSLPSAPSAMEQLLPDPLLCVGLLHVRRLQFPGVVAASPLTKMDTTYALQLRRRRMAIKPLQLAPDDQEGVAGGVTYGGGGIGGSSGGTSGGGGGSSNSSRGSVRRGPGGGDGGTSVKVKSASAGLCGGPPNKTKEFDF